MSDREIRTLQRDGPSRRLYAAQWRAGLPLTPCVGDPLLHPARDSGYWVWEDAVEEAMGLLTQRCPGLAGWTRDGTRADDVLLRLEVVRLLRPEDGMSRAIRAVGTHGADACTVAWRIAGPDRTSGCDTGEGLGIWSVDRARGLAWIETMSGYRVEFRAGAEGISARVDAPGSGTFRPRAIARLRAAGVEVTDTQLEEDLRLDDLRLDDLLSVQERLELT